MSNIMVRAFKPRNIAGCLRKKAFQREGGHGHPRTPFATPFKILRKQGMEHCCTTPFVLHNLFVFSMYLFCVPKLVCDIPRL